MNRSQLLRRVHTAWEALEQSFAALSEARLTEPGVSGEWSVKDILAHVTTWEAEALKYLPLIVEGGTPPRYASEGGIDVFNATWAAVTPTGGFVDPKIPAGYAPFGIQTIGARIFVTFAKQGPGAKDEIDGQGLGFVDAFDTDGNLLVRVAQRGQLNAPWGLALAPASFGRFGGDLLVGNFGDGHVNAYQELPDGTFELIGALRTADGRKLVIDGLWALQFGHGTVNNGPIDTLFFTAGPDGEADGLFGTITAA